jgi:CheY-like chemotaxis protein
MDILLVEDNPGDARLAQEAFSFPNSPIKLHIVSNGEAAMAFLRREGGHSDAPRPHVILLDLALPETGGLEVLAKIKNDKHLKAVPTIILSTSDLESDIRSAYENYAQVVTSWTCFTRETKASHFVGFNEVWLGLVKFPNTVDAL